MGKGHKGAKDKNNHDGFIKHAQNNPMLKDGELELDDTALISRGDEAGAYVQTWLWVENPDCADCGKQIDGEPIYFMQTSARCEACHDKRMQRGSQACGDCGNKPSAASDITSVADHGRCVGCHKEWQHQNHQEEDA